MHSDLQNHHLTFTTFVNLTLAQLPTQGGARGVHDLHKKRLAPSRPQSPLQEIYQTEKIIGSRQPSVFTNGKLHPRYIYYCIIIIIIIIIIVIIIIIIITTNIIIIVLLKYYLWRS